MGSFQRQKGLLEMTALFLAYYAAARAGLSLATIHSSATAVWAPTGIALAAFLMFGSRLWPAVFLAAFLVNLGTMGNLATALGIATGNTLEVAAAAALVRRYAGGREAVAQPRGLILFALTAGVLSPVIGASFGVVSLLATGYAEFGNTPVIWLTWWMGDMAGALIVGPFLLTWSNEPSLIARRTWFEFLAMLATVAATGLVVFCGVGVPGEGRYPVEFLFVPVLMWAGFRFRPREAAAVALVMAACALWGTWHGYGPFARDSPGVSLLLLQAFLCVKTTWLLILTALICQRREAMEQLERASVTDPLTGVGNFRMLYEHLDAEIERSSRTGRPFAVVFLDLDGLKDINDVHGHLVGNRALCRAAEILRRSCRGVDVVARFGGDEFVVVMPETDEAEAHAACTRMLEQFAQDGEAPPISASLGVALYPAGGATAAALLRGADRKLYGMKAARDEEAPDADPATA